MGRRVEESHEEDRETHGIALSDLHLLLLPLEAHDKHPGLLDGQINGNVRSLEGGIARLSVGRVRDARGLSVENGRGGLHRAVVRGGEREE